VTGIGESQGKSRPTWTHTKKPRQRVPSRNAESRDDDLAALFEPESDRGSVQTKDAAEFTRPSESGSKWMKLTKSAAGTVRFESVPVESDESRGKPSHDPRRVCGSLASQPGGSVGAWIQQG